MNTISWEDEADRAVRAEFIAAHRHTIPVPTVFEARAECAAQLALVRRLLAEDMAASVHDTGTVQGLLFAEAQLRYEMGVLNRDE